MRGMIRSRCCACAVTDTVNGTRPSSEARSRRLIAFASSAPDQLSPVSVESMDCRVSLGNDDFGEVGEAECGRCRLCRLLEDLAADQYAADLRGAGADLVELCIAQQPAGRELVDVAVAAQD